MKFGKLSLLVFLDFSKASDTIAHDTLIMKMHNQGFSKQVLSCTASYLIAHIQFVRVDAKLYSTLSTVLSIPQRSIHGPMILLFIIILSRHPFCTNTKILITNKGPNYKYSEEDK